MPPRVLVIIINLYYANWQQIIYLVEPEFHHLMYLWQAPVSELGYFSAMSNDKKKKESAAAKYTALDNRRAD